MNLVQSHAPGIIGEFEVDCQEFMHVVYMPVAMPWTSIQLPENLRCFEEIVLAVRRKARLDDYVYLTVKHMYGGAGVTVNRPGWHIDGYGSDDINYIWYDCVPTEFCVQDFYLSDDHSLSMQQMENQAEPRNIRTYPANTLLELDNTVVHRVGVSSQPVLRTFVKVSVSKNKYNLKGNAHNYLFDYDWPMQDREQQRNHPIKGEMQ